MASKTELDLAWTLGKMAFGKIREFVENLDKPETTSTSPVAPPVPAQPVTQCKCSQGHEPKTLAPVDQEEILAALHAWLLTQAETDLGPLKLSYVEREKFGRSDYDANTFLVAVDDKKYRIGVIPA